MADADLKEHIASRIAQMRDFYVRDFEALDEVRLRNSLGGVARAPYDFTYEVVFVNRRIAQRLRGEVPESYDAKGWMSAPDEFRDKKRAAAEVASSADEVLAAWNALPVSDLKKEYETQGGKSTYLDAASLAASHMMYHDAQLNYIQSLDGDDEMHWG